MGRRQLGVLDQWPELAFEGQEPWHLEAQAVETALAHLQREVALCVGMSGRDRRRRGGGGEKAAPGRCFVFVVGEELEARGRERGGAGSGRRGERAADAYAAGEGGWSREQHGRR